MIETIIITDTSVLINFLVLDQVELLAKLTAYRFAVTEHVRAEITEHHPDQLERLSRAFELGIIEEVCVTDIDEVQLFAELTASGLGIGECSAIAVAAKRHAALAIDDRRAVKKLANLGIVLTVVNTELLLVRLIKQGMLTIEQADVMKRDWEQSHRFKLKFVSFAERLSENTD